MVASLWIGLERNPGLRVSNLAMFIGDEKLILNQQNIDYISWIFELHVHLNLYSPHMGFGSVSARAHRIHSRSSRSYPTSDGSPSRVRARVRRPRPRGPAGGGSRASACTAKARAASVSPAANMESNEQAQRLEVISVGGDRSRRILERLLVGAEPFVAEPEDMERVGVLANVQKKLIEIADHVSVALEPEGMRRLALESRCPREPATHGRSALVSFTGKRTQARPWSRRESVSSRDTPRRRERRHPCRFASAAASHRAWERILESSGSADTGLIEAGGSRVVSSITRARRYPVEAATACCAGRAVG